MSLVSDKRKAVNISRRKSTSANTNPRKHSETRSKMQSQRKNKKSTQMEPQWDITKSVAQVMKERTRLNMKRRTNQLRSKQSISLEKLSENP